MKAKYEAKYLRVQRHDSGLVLIPMDNKELRTWGGDLIENGTIMIEDNIIEISGDKSRNIPSLCMGGDGHG